MRRAQPVQRQQRQRRRAVDQHEVVLAVDFIDGLLEPALAVIEFDQFDFRTGQLAVGRQHVVPAGLGFLARLRDAGQANQHLVHAVFQRLLVDA
ncbi:hypothetical protein D3C80_1876740 [compost metagenome]